jgi:hypothetical protein
MVFSGSEVRGSCVKEKMLYDTTLPSLRCELSSNNFLVIPKLSRPRNS